MENRSRKKQDSGITFLQVLLITAVGVLVTLAVFFFLLPALSDKRPAAETTTEAAAEAILPAEEETEKQVISVTVETTAPPETEPPKPVVMRFAGDILMDPNYAVMATLLNRTGGKPAAEQAFDEGALSLMRDADIFMVNNEFPYSLRGTPLLNKQYTFRADLAYASLLADMGADIVSLANSHMFDHGEDALLDTL
ncbi:MAG: CapA family protein, partial [Lachnospiraceae bacterium]|nr:CapA family protein [Candidatus Hippenecus merdae]